MGESFVNFGRIAWLIGVAVLVMVANVLASVLYMVVYSHLIDPGHDQAYYDAHIQVAAPYCSIVAGIPLMFLAGYWISRWWGGAFAVQSALVVWLVYAVIDIAIVTAVAPWTLRSAMIVAVSHLTKLAAVYVGALVGRRRATI